VDENSHLGDIEIKETDRKICSLTAEERYEIIRKYNADYSIRRKDSEQNAISETRDVE